MPTFAGDEIDPARSDGDLAVQACADDPHRRFHAIRNLTRIGRGVVALRWSQSGFGRTSSTDVRADDAPQPHGLQGRHQQHRRRGHRAPQRARVGVGHRRPGVDARRQLPRDPAHPHAARGLGPLDPRRPGAHHRAGQGQRRAARRHQGARRRQPRGQARRRTGDPCSTPTSGWRHPRRTTASGCCVAATPSPTASTRSPTSSTPASSSSPTSAIHAPASSRCRSACAPTRSTSTSGTTAPRCSRARRASTAVATSARPSSPDRLKGRCG